MIERRRTQILALAAAATLGMGSVSTAATLFADNFDANLDDTDPAGWIYNTPGGANATQPADRTSVQSGVVEVLGQSGGTFVQVTPGSDSTFDSYATGSNNKLILSADIAGNASSGTHIDHNTGMYLYADSSSSINGQTVFYNFQFHAGTGAIQINERSTTNGSPANLASTTVTTLVDDGLFTSIDLNDMNSWRLEVTHNSTSADLELFLNDVSVLSHTDATPRDITNVTPAAFGASGNDYRFDNADLSAVPEPASLGLMGLAGLALMRRRNA